MELICIWWAEGGGSVRGGLKGYEEGLEGEGEEEGRGAGEHYGLVVDELRSSDVDASVGEEQWGDAIVGGWNFFLFLDKSL